MEPPTSFCSSFWSFIVFLPFFAGLLLLGILKGTLLCPLICTIMSIGNSAVILGLWPAHCLWTFYCIARSKILGPVLKIVVFIGVAVVLILWPIVGVAGSVIGGAGYGFFSPLMATFEAVGEGKTDKFRRCFVDGTWSTVRGSCTVVRDLSDVCFYSYFSIMDDLRLRSPPHGQRYEISIMYLVASILVGLAGIMIDIIGISLIAICKSPYMLVKGWQRLFHDLIGREGPFLETACVPFAALAILLWPATVIAALVASLLSAFLLGGYATVVTYQERSVTMGMRYIIASVAMYDEYSNDMLDMGEGSCLPRLGYRKGEYVAKGQSFGSRGSSSKTASRSVSFKNSVLELNPLKLLEHLFAECEVYGEELISKGLITAEEVGDYSKAGKGVVRVGLPAYAILRTLLRSAAAEAEGILLSDETEITASNKPRDTFFDWFLEPLIIIKEQIRAEKLSCEEEEYLCRLVLFAGDSIRAKESTSGGPLEFAERRRAEIDAIARRTWPSSLRNSNIIN
ncbi:putative membrane protein At3g27390 isoform X2 [Wolffia australiana]